MAKKLPPVHPGEILREEFLVPLKLTPYAVAVALNVPRTPDRTHRARRKARYGRHRAATRQILQDRRCVLDEYSGAFRSRNGRRRARAADQEDRVLRGGVRAMQIARGAGRNAEIVIPRALQQKKLPRRQGANLDELQMTTFPVAIRPPDSLRFEREKLIGRLLPRISSWPAARCRVHRPNI